jgi:hypothetical protein
MENTNLNQPRVVNISKTQVATMLGFGWTREQMAKALNITTKDMFKAMRDLGFYEQRKTNNPKVDYVINLTFDELVINPENPMDLVVEEQPQIIVDNYQEGSDEAVLDPSATMENSESVSSEFSY